MFDPKHQGPLRQRLIYPLLKRVEDRIITIPGLSSAIVEHSDIPNTRVSNGVSIFHGSVGDLVPESMTPNQMVQKYGVEVRPGSMHMGFSSLEPTKFPLHLPSENIADDWQESGYWIVCDHSCRYGTEGF